MCCLFWHSLKKRQTFILSECLEVEGVIPPFYYSFRFDRVKIIGLAPIWATSIFMLAGSGHSSIVFLQSVFCELSGKILLLFLSQPMLFNCFSMACICGKSTFYLLINVLGFKAKTIYLIIWLPQVMVRMFRATLRTKHHCLSKGTSHKLVPLIEVYNKHSRNECSFVGGASGRTNVTHKIYLEWKHRLQELNIFSC